MRNALLRIILLVLILAGVSIWIFLERKNDASTSIYEYLSEERGISFKYPAQYFIHEIDESSGERKQYTIVVMEDTPMNRALASGEIHDTDGPPTITISLFQNNLDNYTARRFVEETNFSNFKLSDGTLAQTFVAGEPALRYRATGLWENYNVVVTRPEFVYMFTVFFNAPGDPLVSDFENILKSVKFAPVEARDAGEIPTSADDAPPGSIHNLPLPPAVRALRAYVAKLQNISEGKVIILSAYEREWPDACLGLASTEEICAQVLTPGFEVTVQAKGKEYIYRTNKDASVIREKQ